jgi:hypothetical protein
MKNNDVLESQSATKLLKRAHSSMSPQKFLAIIDRMGICHFQWVASTTHGGAQVQIRVLKNGFWGVNKIPPLPIPSIRTSVCFYSSRFDYLLKQVEGNQWRLE